MKRINKAPKTTGHKITGLFLCLSLSACTTTHVPGLDRILFPNSSAKVGPLIDATEENVTTDSQNTKSAPIETKPSIAPSPAQKPVQTQQGVAAEKKTAAEQTPSKLESAQSAKAPKTGTRATEKPSKVSSTKAITNKAITQRTESSQEATQASAKKVDSGAVSGQVILIGEGGKALAATGTLISLTPKNRKVAKPTSAPKTHVIDMLNKEYQPRYSTINAGDQVVFVNKDNIRHNVFSPSGSNAFDLGTYGAGLKRAVKLEAPGVVKIYCNIHADMATFVAVGDPGLSAKADAQGRYQINDVPVGSYELTIWNIRGETKQAIEVTKNKTVKLLDRVDTTAFVGETHKNKFGGNYSKNAALFEDEFY